MKLKVLFLLVLIVSFAMIAFPASYTQTTEDEPNDSPGQATTLGASGIYPCSFQSWDSTIWGDDYYVFSADAGQTVDVTADPNSQTDIAIDITDMSGNFLVNPPNGVDNANMGGNEYISGFSIPSTGSYCIIAYEATAFKSPLTGYVLYVTITELSESDPPTYPGGNAGIKEVIRYFNNTANVYWYEATDASQFHYNIYVQQGVVDATTLFATAPYKQVDAPAHYTNVTGINSDLTYTFGVRAEDTYNNLELNTEIIISDPPTSVHDSWEVYN